MQISAFRGSLTVTSFRLCSRAPWTTSSSAAIACQFYPANGRSPFAASVPVLMVSRATDVKEARIRLRPRCAGLASDGRRRKADRRPRDRRPRRGLPAEPALGARPLPSVPDLVLAPGEEGEGDERALQDAVARAREVDDDLSRAGSLHEDRRERSRRRRSPGRAQDPPRRPLRRVRGRQRPLGRSRQRPRSLPVRGPRPRPPADPIPESLPDAWPPRVDLRLPAAALREPGRQALARCDGVAPPHGGGVTFRKRTPPPLLDPARRLPHAPRVRDVVDLELARDQCPVAEQPAEQRLLDLDRPRAGEPHARRPAPP